jgi:3,4-dihydroxy 2-butanone 4-phosphate synthase/GTP cyclohydrolase II
MIAFDISPAVTIPTERGSFRAQAFRRRDAAHEHLALVRGDPVGEPIAVRIHSECLTGDVFGSQRCDCQSQLIGALDLIAERRRGMLIYLRQEGRGIGLVDKLRAYALQDEGLDTVDANVALGHAVDARTYEDGLAILAHYSVECVELITNNPDKVAAVREAGIDVVRQVPAVPVVNEHNQAYLRAKSERLRHLLQV